MVLNIKIDSYGKWDTVINGGTLKEVKVVGKGNGYIKPLTITNITSNY